MNLVTGDTIKVSTGMGKWFTAEIVGSWYNDKGHHLFNLNIIEKSGYSRKPKSEWRGKDLYEVVLNHTKGPNHEDAAQRKIEQKLNNDVLCPRYAQMLADQAYQKEQTRIFNEKHRIEVDLETAETLEKYGPEGTLISVDGFRLTFEHTGRTEFHKSFVGAFESALDNLCKHYCDKVTINTITTEVVAYQNWNLDKTGTQKWLRVWDVTKPTLTITK